MFSILNHKVWLPVFEGEDPGEGSGKGSGEGPGEGSGKGSGEGNKSGDADANITQEQLNGILAAEKKKHQKLVQKAIDEANAMRSKAQLTSKENQEHDARIEQLQSQLLTKEEQGKRAADKARKAHTEEKKALEADRDYWKGSYTNSTIERSLTDAAATNNAFSPKQIVAILGRDTQLAPVLDEEGNPTGVLEPKVRFQTKNADGKSVTLELSPGDAVKRMKEEDEYLNLFKGEGSGGAGLRSQPGGKRADIKNVAKDAAAYRKGRREGTINFQ